MNTTNNHRFESHIHPIMNPFLTVLENAIKKLPNNALHLDNGLYFCYFDHSKNILITEEYGHVKVDQKHFHMHNASMKVTRTLCANKTKSSEVFDPASQQLLEAGAIKIGKDFAGGSGNGIMSDPLICEATATIWLIAKDLYHKGGSRASQDSSFWTKILKEAKIIHEEISPENNFILEIAEAMNVF
ncbi:MAG: hypothetical protein V4504_01345 [Patescibacteria group bacterium]